MPILSKNFFEIYKPDTGFFSKWQAFGKWDSVCLPVYEWDGVLFIGCLELPSSDFFTEFKEKFPQARAVPVMCDSASLKEIWSTLSGSLKTSLLTNASVELPASAPIEGGFESLLQDAPEELAALADTNKQEEAPESLDLNFAPPDEPTKPSEETKSGFNFGGIQLQKTAPKTVPEPTIETTTKVKPLPPPTV